MIKPTLPTQWWPSPAKLNLFLHITGRNPKGYHLLQTLFQLVDIGDELAFEITDDGKISLQTALSGVEEKDNLIFKAAQKLQQFSGCKLGCKIWLKKKLPMGGGIGGGSSNAATTLVALNALWNTKLNEAELAQIGLTLGADVPIFIHGKTAFAEGVGEQITSTTLAEKTYLIVFPNCHVSTAEIFAADDLPRNSAKIQWQDYNFAETRNDCQKIVCDRYPKVANLLRQLLEYAPSRMTGTGACLFSVFDSFDEAEQVKRSLPEDCQAFVAKGINTSPLYEYLTKVQLTSA